MSTGSGLVETLWAGFATINRRPALLLIPLALDLLVWLGPRLSARPAVEAAGESLGRWLTTMAADPALGSSADQARQVAEELPQQLALLGGVNLVALVGWALPGVVAVDQDFGQLVLPLSGGALAGAVVALIAGGLVLAALYFQLVAQAVRGEPVQLGTAFLHLPRFVARLVLWLVLLNVAAFAIGIPALLVIGLVGLVSPMLGVGVVLMLWSLGLIAAWWLFFHTSAMFVSDLGPVRALFASVGVVARERGASLLFVAIVWLVSTGWALVWSGFEGVPGGGLIRIAGQSYLSGGLAAATMIFYRDRFAAQVPVTRSGQQPV